MSPAILVLVCNPVLRGEVADALGRANITDLLFAGTVAEASSVLESNRPALSLVDIDLGGTSGLPAAAALIDLARKLNHGHRLFLVTTMAGEWLVKAAAALDVSGLIHWPADMARLNAILFESESKT